MLLLYLLHGAEDRAGLRRSLRDGRKRLRILCDCVQCFLQQPVTREAVAKLLYEYDQARNVDSGAADMVK